MKLFAALALLALVSSLPPQHQQNQAARLFADSSILELRLEAPLGRLFAESRSRSSESSGVDGTLSYVDQSTNETITIQHVRVKVRGNTSRQDSECAFPKLRLDFKNGDVPAASLFSDVETVKIGTHCDDRPDAQLTKLGRWANEKAPIREAFVYRILHAAHVRTLEARPARITYVDDHGAPLVRGAMLLEDEHAAFARLGGDGELKDFSSARDDFTIDDSARLAFAEAMIGNFDWSVKLSPDDYYRTAQTHPLWNVAAVRRASGPAFPLMYDFDLSGIVTGGHPWFPRVYFDGFLASHSHPAIEVLGQVQRTRTVFDRAVLDRTRRWFEGQRPAIDQAVASAIVDDEGRRFARAYLDSFFDAIAHDDVFYRPVVVQSGALPYSTADRDEDACGAGDRIPVGTAVGDPVERRGGRVKVPLLDVWWHWASRCDAVHKGPVWIDASTIGRDFPSGQTSVSAK